MMETDLVFHVASLITRKWMAAVLLTNVLWTLPNEITMHDTAMIRCPTDEATEVGLSFLLAAAPCVTGRQEEGDYEDEEDVAAESADRYAERDFVGRREVWLNMTCTDSVSAFVFDISQRSLLPLHTVDLAHNEAHARAESEHVNRARQQDALAQEESGDTDYR